MDKNKLFTVILFSSFGIMTACGLTEAVADNQKASENTATNAAANNRKNAENKATDTARSKTIELFDGRGGEIKNTKPSAAETALVEKEVRVKSKEDFLKTRLEGLAENVDWEKEFSVDGVAEGAFTNANSKQKAILYRFSYTNGVIVLEDGNIVAHFSGGPGDYAFYFAIKALPDVTQNGLSEIVLFRNVEDNDDVLAYLFESEKDSVNFLGEARYFTSSYIAGDDTDSEKAKQTAYRITVQQSVNPTFLQEIYERTGSKAKWVLTEKAEKFSLDKKIEAKLTNIR
jgi:hypothetical protein